MTYVKKGMENYVHFLLECKKLTDKRDEDILNKYVGREKEEIMGEIIFKERNKEKVTSMLGRRWRKREVMRKKNHKA